MSIWEQTTAQKSSGADSVSVSQAVALAADAIGSLPQITVLGEVTGFRGPNARSGHCYFQIKDDAAAMDCIIWKGAYAKRSFDLRDGLQVNLTGSFDLYRPTGRMSFVARSFALAGEGLLRQQVAALAEKLRREGLMDVARKRPIPAFCMRVAVVTSLSGAVIDDVKRTLRRRNPLVEIICVGAKVQGEGAPAELVEALERAAALRPAPECILLVRGGGSFEDLMTFNDEALARAVAASPIPVVTGIGHEPDTSICDMVSDRRASTPTAAAESVAPAKEDLATVLETRAERLARTLSLSVATGVQDTEAARTCLARAMQGLVARERMRLEAQAARPVLASPGAAVERRVAELEQTAERLARAGGSSVRACGHDLVLAISRLRGLASSILSLSKAELAAAAAQLDALSPLQVLARGYSIAYTKDKVADSVAAFEPGAALRVRMADGEVLGTVSEVIRREF
ncbi:exodeoxyribonuclease VII large subunit [Collinsella sp. AGMB00827]|uniref:Exodeoxyribonuclease 7 large subunit n=1 Tax=Collinsella ureilytica TaxID=2869515 RepID=A0ABS7MIW7_9ACTN|nr:exodeoxyribonuclease VII large subunit [Collinsella urealyticum]